MTHRVQSSAAWNTLQLVLFNCSSCQNTLCFCTGAETLPRSAFACKRQACVGITVPRSASGASIASAASFGSLRAVGRASHWDAVRAHFLHFRPAASAATRGRWYAAVDAAVASAAQLRSEAAAAAEATMPSATEATTQQHQPPQQQSPAQAPCVPAGGKAASGERAIAISAIAAPAAPTAAEAEERAAMRQSLGGPSYRRLATGGSPGVPLVKGASLGSFRGLVQQLSVH